MSTATDDVKTTGGVWTTPNGHTVTEAHKREGNFGPHGQHQTDHTVSYVGSDTTSITLTQQEGSRMGMDYYVRSSVKIVQKDGVEHSRSFKYDSRQHPSGGRIQHHAQTGSTVDEVRAAMLGIGQEQERVDDMMFKLLKLEEVQFMVLSVEKAQEAKADEDLSTRDME